MSRLRPWLFPRGLSCNRKRCGYFFVPVKSAVPAPKSSTPFIVLPSTSPVIVMSCAPWGLCTENANEIAVPLIVPLTSASP